MRGLTDNSQSSPTFITPFGFGTPTLRLLLYRAQKGLQTPETVRLISSLPHKERENGAINGRGLPPNPFGIYRGILRHRSPAKSLTFNRSNAKPH